MSDDVMERLIAQAVRFAQSGRMPVEPRLAATVLLLRRAPAGFEVYLLRRAASMAFASGMYAFPGGSVDPADYDGPPVPGDWAVRLGQPAPVAAAVVRAAVREIAEETGVPLTAAALAPWTRWVTPEFEPRRYDTYFFVAALPDGTLPADISGEADRTEWLRPRDALTQFETGKLAMLPPTAVTLAEVGECESVEAVLAAAADRDAATAILPRVERGPDGEFQFIQ